MNALEPLPAKTVAAADGAEVAGDVTRVVCSIVNAYLVGPPGAPDRGWVLVDAGMSFSGKSIAAAAAGRFGPRSRPAAIVLTHGHFDHVGAVRELAEAWDAPVYAHPLELPFLTGKADYPPPDPGVGGGLMALTSPVFSRRGIDLGNRVHPLPANGTVPGMPGWRWYHTPGHAPGHVSFFRADDRVLIVGDAFVTTKQESALAVLTQAQFVWRPPAYFTIDWSAARSSVQSLAMLKPAVAATGHGVPMRGEELRRGLADLAANFEAYMPTDGRYVRRPAVASETGIVSTPPPAWGPLAATGAAFGVGVLAGLAVGRRT